MTTQTITKNDIHAEIDALPDAAIEKLAHYVAALSCEDETNAGTCFCSLCMGTPNAETLAAIKEVDEGGGTRYSSAEELFEDLGI